MKAPRARATMLLGAACLALLGAGCRGGEPIARVNWQGHAPLSGTVRDGAVELTSPPEGAVFRLATIQRPAVEAPGYTVAGQVRYSDVAGKAYLEMWSVFPNGDRFFTRTLSDAGPLAAMEGSSDWRRFELPFRFDGATPPERLDIGVVLPGRGTVAVGPLELLPFGATPNGAWWSDRDAGLVGGVLGSIVGVLGAMIGWLVARRRARVFVLRSMTVIAIAGVVTVAVAIVAWASGQPYAVWYPLLLVGGIGALLFGTGIRRVSRVYAEAELQRIRAADVG